MQPVWESHIRGMLHMPALLSERLLHKMLFGFRVYRTLLPSYVVHASDNTCCGRRRAEGKNAEWGHAPKQSKRVGMRECVE